MFDVIVIGAGVAGLTAATHVASNGLSCALIDPMGGGGELMNLGELHECEDIAHGMIGPDFGADLLQKALEAGVALTIGSVVDLTHDQFWLARTDEETLSGKAVILASGLTPGTVGVANEAAFEGSGLSHCAACDGPLYKDLPVVVVGASRWALQEAAELSSGCSQVTLVTERDDVAAPAGVALMRGKVTGLDGQGSLESVTVRGADGSKIVPARGIFIQDGRAASVQFAPRLEQDGNGLVRATETGATNLPLVFAAGSLRTGLDSTIPQVAADGVRAAQAAIEATRAF